MSTDGQQACGAKPAAPQVTPKVPEGGVGGSAPLGAQHVVGVGGLMPRGACGGSELRGGGG